MKKFLTILLILIFTIIPLHIAFANEKVVDVNVKNKIMRAYEMGSGERTIVLLSGFGTENPIDDFKNLADELSKNFKVVVLEYFGYGKSDVTLEERSNKIIVGEIRIALRKLNIKPPYILMPHSMSGLYCVYYSKFYPEEVSAIVGIDMSLPQKQLERFTEESFEKCKIDHNDSETNVSLKNQWNNFFDNSKELENLRFDKNLPVLLFLATEQIKAVEEMRKSGEMKTSWFDINRSMISNSEIQFIKVLDGSHYLHREQKDEMVKNVQNFIENKVAKTVLQ